MRLSGSRRYQKGAQGASAPSSLPRLVAASSALFLDANVLGPHLGLNSAFLFEPFGLLFEECGDLIRGECFFDAAAGQPGDRYAQLGCDDRARMRSGASQLQQPLRRIGLAERSARHESRRLPGTAQVLLPGTHPASWQPSSASSSGEFCSTSCNKSNQPIRVLLPRR